MPRAGLLGSIAGIALMLLGFLPLIETLRVPVVGFVTFGLLLYVLVAKGRLPVKIPGRAARVRRRHRAVLRRWAWPGWARRASRARCGAAGG